MNTHMTTPEYAEGYIAFSPTITLMDRQKLCPYIPGSSRAARWLEGWNDARDDRDDGRRCVKEDAKHTTNAARG